MRLIRGHHRLLPPRVVVVMTLAHHGHGFKRYHHERIAHPQIGSFVEAGGLMAYGIDLVEVFRQAGRAIDRILKGAKPADLPFYQPTKFEFVINRWAAKEIGLVVSETLLAQADEVIE